MRPTPCGCTSALLSGFTGTALFAARPQLLLRRPTFSVLPEKVGKKRRLDADRIVPQATEEPRRKTLQPTHGNPSAKLHYSAACMVTTLPSIIIATQENGKTRCCGNNRLSAYALMVQHICKGGHGRLPCLFFTYVCRGRCPHQPAQCMPVSRKSMANSSVPNGPMCTRKG